MLPRSNLLFALLFVVTVSLYAEASTTVRGVVSDTTGAPIPQASVGLYSVDGDWDTHTDSQGKFNIVGVPPGTYELEVKSPGFTPKLISDLKVGQTDLVPMTIALTVGSCPPCCGSSPTCSIADVSYSETSAKSVLKGQLFSVCKKSMLANATVALYKMWKSESPATVRTGEHGDFLFSDLEPGRYELQFSSQGYPDTLVFNVRIKRHKIAVVREEFGQGSGRVVISCPSMDIPISSPKFD